MNVSRRKLKRAAQMHLDFTGAKGATLETWECHPSMDGKVGCRFGYLDFLVVKPMHGVELAIGFDDSRVGIGAGVSGKPLIIVGLTPIPKMYEEIFLKYPRKRRIKIGRMNAIAYNAIRNGKKNKYLHEFESTSRPLLTVTRDGYWLVSGGKYQFTDRGIEDR